VVVLWCCRKVAPEEVGLPAAGLCPALVVGVPLLVLLTGYRRHITHYSCEKQIRESDVDQLSFLSRQQKCFYLFLFSPIRTNTTPGGVGRLPRLPSLNLLLFSLT
jgi:hypothetical protein